MSDFRFERTLTTAEREVLVEFHGEAAVKRHAVFLANFHRVNALFPVQPDTAEMAAWRRGEDLFRYEEES